MSLGNIVIIMQDILQLTVAIVNLKFIVDGFLYKWYKMKLKQGDICHLTI